MLSNLPFYGAGGNETLSPSPFLYTSLSLIICLFVCFCSPKRKLVFIHFIFAFYFKYSYFFFFTYIFPFILHGLIHLRCSPMNFTQLFNIFFLFSTFFNCCSSTVVSISPHHSSPPQPFPLPTLDCTPVWFCPCVLYTCS